MTSILRLRDDDLGTLAMFSSLRKKKDWVNLEKKFRKKNILNFEKIKFRRKKKFEKKIEKKI